MNINKIEIINTFIWGIYQGLNCSSMLVFFKDLITLWSPSFVLAALTAQGQYRWFIWKVTKLKKKTCKTYDHIVWSCLSDVCNLGNTCRYRNHHNLCRCVHIYIRHKRLTPCWNHYNAYPRWQVLVCYSTAILSYILLSKRWMVAKDPIYRELVLNNRAK